MSLAAPREVQDYLAKSIQGSVYESIFFQRMQRAELVPNQLRIFASQRVPMGQRFNGLLEVGIQLCDLAAAPNMAAVLRTNLSDELGGQTGEPHSIWKADYLRAIGVDPCGPRKLLESTQRIVDAYETVAQRRNLQEIVGVLLALEFSIPKEYRAAIRCRDALFPQKFVIAPGDPPNLIEQKKRARRYMDDHAEHDEKVHYRQIIDAIGDVLQNSECVVALINGINVVKTGRKAFYDDLSSLIGKKDNDLGDFY